MAPAEGLMALVKKRKAKPVARQWDVMDLLARMERAGFTGITTRRGVIYFNDAEGVAGCFPYEPASAGARGTDYLVAGPGTGAKLDGAHEAGTGIISEYALVRLLGVYKAHPLVDF